MKKVKIGQKIKIDDGYSERYGKVYGNCQNRFGEYLRVKMDDFTFETVHSLSTVGIGAYLIGDVE